MGELGEIVRGCVLSMGQLMMRAQACADAVEGCFADGIFVPCICRGGELRELARNG